MLPAPTAINFPEELKRARVNSGLTLKQLAEKAEISEVMPGRYENRKAVPTHETWDKLNKALNLKPEENRNNEYIVKDISIEIKDDVYSRLESNTKGFQTPSDTIGMTIYSHEVLSVIKMVTASIESSEEVIQECGFREKNILFHYSSDVIDEAMLFVLKMFPNYTINYNCTPNALNLNIENRSTKS
ncbi:helix-turn-helix transcriptional regulator [Photobacterium sp. MCCC 1A19761]|uniref:helix-turn-helix domain-containing protein n=1 Tax=Photobacterium sp. MCCC 1A19761 TaxID=3115000 RepID=UPI00307E7039